MRLSGYFTGKKNLEILNGVEIAVEVAEKHLGDGVVGELKIPGYFRIQSG